MYSRLTALRYICTQIQIQTTDTSADTITDTNTDTNEDTNVDENTNTDTNLDTNTDTNTSNLEMNVFTTQCVTLHPHCTQCSPFKPQIDEERIVT